MPWICLVPFMWESWSTLQHWINSWWTYVLSHHCNPGITGATALCLSFSQGMVLCWHPPCSGDARLLWKWTGKCWTLISWIKSKWLVFRLGLSPLHPCISYPAERGGKAHTAPTSFPGTIFLQLTLSPSYLQPFSEWVWVSLFHKKRNGSFSKLYSEAQTNICNV